MSLGPLPTGRMTTRSAFTITTSEAHQIVSEWNIMKKQQLLDTNNNDSTELETQSCYLIHITVRPVYSECALPPSCYKKLPRLINNIPLCAGKLTLSQSENIKWRFIEGTNSYLSVPMCRSEANESRRILRDNLVQHGKQVFGEMTVKVNVVLTECLKYDEELFINDIAYPSDEGLHFTD